MYSKAIEYPLGAKALMVRVVRKPNRRARSVWVTKQQYRRKNGLWYRICTGRHQIWPPFTPLSIG